MASVVMPRPTVPIGNVASSSAERHRLWRWFVAGALVAFAIPLVGVSVLGLHHDLYLLVYFTVMGTFLISFLAHNRFDWRAWLGTRLGWSILTGVVVAFAIVRNVMNQTSMAHPAGSFFWFELGWRGVLYGLMDALTLFVFPATVAYLLLGDSNRRRRLRFAGLTLLLSMGITATYHLGYPQFRDADLLQPEIGALVATIPTAVTGNPVGAIVVHDAYHVAANVHTYRSEIYLPPALDGYAEHGSGAAGVGLAAIWIVLAGSVIYLGRHRLFPSTDR